MWKSLRRKDLISASIQCNVGHATQLQFRQAPIGHNRMLSSAWSATGFDEPTTATGSRLITRPPVRSHAVHRPDNDHRRCHRTGKFSISHNWAAIPGRTENRDRYHPCHVSRPTLVTHQWVVNNFGISCKGDVIIIVQNAPLCWWSQLAREISSISSIKLRAHPMVWLPYTVIHLTIYVNTSYHK